MSRLVETWSELKAAVRGTHQDYTEGPIGRAILLLAVPMVLETAMESIFVVVDVFFVSRLGYAAVTAVGLTESMLTLVYTLAMGLSIGVTAMISRRIGEHRGDEASLTAVQAVTLGLLLSTVLGVVGAWAAPDLLRLMGASEEVVAIGTPYTRIMLGGNATILLLFLINAAFRGAGDAVIAMRVLWLANGINIFLDPMLILGIGPFPELGVMGAAVATNIGRGTAVLVQLVTLARSQGRLQVRRRHLLFLPQVMLRLVRLSATGTFQVFIGMASWVGLIRILASFGDQVVAGYTIGIRLIIFALLPSWGMSNAAATLVGQNLGAGQPERAEKSVWMAAFYNMIFLGIIGVVFLLFAPWLVAFFTTEPVPFANAVQCLRVVSCGFLFYAYGMVLTQSFNGAGDTVTPTWLNLIVFWMFELPFGFVAAHMLGMGPFGVYLSMTLSFSALAVLSAVLFRRGRWKTKMV